MDFLRGLNIADQRARAAVEKGLAHAGAALLRDTIMETPTVPLDEGTLRGSGSVHVQGKPVMTSAEMAGGVAGTPNTGSISVPTSGGEMVAHIGFNTPYAARMHEGVEFEFQTTGSGAKFLSQKMASNANAYLGIVARVVKAALGGGAAPDITKI